MIYLANSKNKLLLLFTFALLLACQGLANKGESEINGTNKPIKTNAITSTVTQKIITNISTDTHIPSLSAFTPTADQAPESNGKTNLVVSNDGIVHIVWSDNRNGTWDVYYSYSTDEGLTFSDPITVETSTSSNNAKGNPALAINPLGKVYVAWEDWRNNNWDIYYAYLKNDGAFSDSIRASFDNTGINQRYPVITIGINDAIYLAWSEIKGQDISRIYYSYAEKSDMTLSENIPIDPEGEGSQQDPTIGIDSKSRVHFVWADKRSGSYSIFHSFTNEAGKFGEGEIVANGIMSDLGDYKPQFSIDSNDNIHVVWTCAYIKHPGYGVNLFLPLYSNSMDRGATFAPSRQISKGFSYVSTGQNSTAISATSSGIHIVLETNSPRDGAILWYYNSRDNGLTFLSGAEIEKGDDRNYYDMDITVSNNGNIHVAWITTQSAGQSKFKYWVNYSRSLDGGKTFTLAKTFEN